MKNYYIYGMGKNGIRCYLELIENGIEIQAFIDASTDKQLRKFDGKKCISMEEYIAKKNDCDCVIVSINDINRLIIGELRGFGINAIEIKEFEKELIRDYDIISKINEVKGLYNKFYEGADCIK